MDSSPIKSEMVGASLIDLNTIIQPEKNRQILKFLLLLGSKRALFDQFLERDTDTSVAYLAFVTEMLSFPDLAYLFDSFISYFEDQTQAAVYFDEISQKYPRCDSTVPSINRYCDGQVHDRKTIQCV
jgi:hypothetical protein